MLSCVHLAVASFLGTLVTPVYLGLCSRRVPPAVGRRDWQALLKPSSPSSVDGWFGLALRVDFPYKIFIFLLCDQLYRLRGDCQVPHARETNLICPKSSSHLHPSPPPPLPSPNILWPSPPFPSPPPPPSPPLSPPRGQDIFISIWNLHRSPELWPAAESFNPDRWPLDGPDPNEITENFR